MGVLSSWMVPRPLAPPTHSAKKGVLVLNGRSYFPNTWLVFYGVPDGPGKGICMWCDDTSVVASITLNTPSPPPPRVMDLIRVITLQTLQYNFAFTATHIPGLDNSIADSLSYFQMDHFRILASTASTIPPSAMNTWGSVQRYLHAHLAPSTWRTYQVGVKHFLTFNLTHGFCYVSCYALNGLTGF